MTYGNNNLKVEQMDGIEESCMTILIAETPTTLVVNCVKTKKTRNLKMTIEKTPEDEAFDDLANVIELNKKLNTFSTGWRKRQILQVDEKLTNECIVEKWGSFMIPYIRTIEISHTIVPKELM